MEVDVDEVEKTDKYIAIEYQRVLFLYTLFMHVLRELGRWINRQIDRQTEIQTDRQSSIE